MKKVFWYEFDRSHCWLLLRAAFKVLIHGRHTIWMGYDETERATPKDIADHMTAHGYTLKERK